MVIVVGDEGSHVMEERGIDKEVLLGAGICMQPALLSAGEELLGEACNGSCMMLIDTTGAGELEDASFPRGYAVDQGDLLHPCEIIRKKTILQPSLGGEDPVDGEGLHQGFKDGGAADDDIPPFRVDTRDFPPGREGEGAEETGYPCQL